MGEPSFVPKDLELKSKIHLGVLCLCCCRLISVQIHPHIRKLLPEVRDQGVGVLTHTANNLATFRGKKLGHLFLNLKKKQGEKRGIIKKENYSTQEREEVAKRTLKMNLATVTIARELARDFEEEESKRKTSQVVKPY